MVALPVDPARWRRTAGYYAWRTLVGALLVLVVGWDAATLTIAGDAGYTSDAYTVLRDTTPWGMRAYGPPLVVLFLVSGYAYSRHRGGTVTTGVER